MKLSTANMAALILPTERTIAIPPNMTPEQVMEWLKPFLGQNETVSGIYTYSYKPGIA